MVFDQIHEDDLEDAEGRAALRSSFRKLLNVRLAVVNEVGGPDPSKVRRKSRQGIDMAQASVSVDPSELEDIFYVEVAPCLSQARLISQSNIPCA